MNDTTKLPQEQIKQLTNATATYLGYLKKKPSDMMDIILTLRRERGRIGREKMLSTEGMIIMHKRAYGQAQVSLDKLWAGDGIGAQKWKGYIEEAIAEILDAVPADNQEALLRVTEQEQRWRRAERMYRNGMDIGEIIHNASGAGDIKMLQAIRAELPSLYAGVTGGKQILAGLIEQLDQAEFPLLSEPQRAARDLQKEMETGWYNLTCSYQYALSEVQGNDTCSMLLEWNGDILRVEEGLHLGQYRAIIGQTPQSLLEAS